LSIDVNEEVIRLTKDFIWSHLDDANKSMLIKLSSMTEHERHGLYVSKMFASFDAERSGNLITKERLSISVQFF
jgi:hypothetical protein